MKIAIVGPIATADIGHLLGRKTAGLPVGYPGAPLLGTLITELLERGHKITAVTLSGGMPLDWRQTARAQGTNFEIVYVPMRRRAWQPNGWLPGRIIDLYGFERRGLQHAIEKAAPDIVHAHWSYEFAWAAQRSGHPTLVTCHDSPFLVARMYSRAKPTQSMYRWLKAGMARHVLRHAPHVTAVSPHMQSQAQALCNCPIAIVPNPLPHLVCEKARVLSHQYNADSPLLVMVANGWSGVKNPEPALRAFAALRIRKPRARFRLYGSDFGPGEYAERWARQNELADGMEFIGYVSQARLLDEMAAADVLVHPSLEESFGMSLAEAMALGIPVIGGARSGAVPWLVDKGGILVDVTSVAAIEQAMLALLDTPERYRDFAAAAQARALKHFAPASVADAYEAIYRGIAGRSDSGNSIGRVFGG